MAFENTGALVFANALSKLGDSFGESMKDRYKFDLYSQAADDLKQGRYGDAGAKLLNVDPRAGLQYITQQNATDQFNKMYGATSLSDLGSSSFPNRPMDLAGAILSQESGNNPNIGTSVDGAQGVGQILPDTFKRFAQPGENINNPEDNARVSNRILSNYMEKYHDPARAAVAYFSGEGNVAPTGSATPWKHDTHDGNNKFVSSYVNDVLGRMGGQATVKTAQSGVTMSDANPSLIAKANQIRWLIANPNIPDSMKESAKLELQDIQNTLREERSANRPTEAQRNYNLARQQGFTGSFMDYQQANRASTTVNVGAGENEFMKKSNAKMADMFAAIIDDGDAAQQDLALVSRLGELGQVVNTGGGAALQNWLSQYGVKVGDNIGQIEAYQAIVDKLTPSQRIPGSGTSSDRDMAIFKSSLPSLVRTPEGNQKIIETLTGMANAKIARAQIAEQVMTGQMTPQQGVAEMRKMPSTFKGWQSPQSPAQPKQPQQPQAEAGLIPEPPQGVTPEQINQQAAAKIAANPAMRDVIVRQMMLWKRRIPGLAIP